MPDFLDLKMISKESALICTRSPPKIKSPSQNFIKGYKDFRNMKLISCKNAGPQTGPLADGGRYYDQLYANAPTASKMISDVMIQCLAVQSCMIIVASHRQHAVG
jgi:hypothetical protein